MDSYIELPPFCFVSSCSSDEMYMCISIHNSIELFFLFFFFLLSMVSCMYHISSIITMAEDFNSDSIELYAFALWVHYPITYISNIAKNSTFSFIYISLCLCFSNSYRPFSFNSPSQSFFLRSRTEITCGIDTCHDT